MLNDSGGPSVKELRDYGASQKVVNGPAHSGWLGVSQEEDARATVIALAGKKYDWLVVDHYALDSRWESALRSRYEKLLVIDDLADRQHACDLLLDQNLGRTAADYANLVPEHCAVLAGPRLALLRPEFWALREYSLRRRESPALKHLLITMGGVDQPNASGQVLEALKTCPLPADCKITVVMGDKAPWLAQVYETAATMPWPTEVRVNISDMAQVMADSDLAIGAAGTTSWERCSLGLPVLLVVLAENQWPGARALLAAGAASLIGDASAILEQLAPTLIPLLRGEALANMSRFASNISDGQGCARVVGQMESLQ
jgi:UDP-2,4-diacetamido-2,4,6-trideoxy-beta-L-altropyranose hydrolase